MRRTHLSVISPASTDGECAAGDNAGMILVEASDEDMATRH